jgi:hypothetical protein
VLPIELDQASSVRPQKQKTSAMTSIPVLRMAKTIQRNKINFAVKPISFFLLLLLLHLFIELTANYSSSFLSLLFPFLIWAVKEEEDLKKTKKKQKPLLLVTFQTLTSKYWN